MRWCVGLLAILFSLPAFAAPRVLALYPTGGQRGQTVSVTLSGEALKEVTGAWIATPGLTVTLQPGGDGATRTAQIAIAADAAPGVYELRFLDATGLSNVRYFQVGALPEALEKEPNDDTTPQAVTLPITINGRISQNPDRDSFKFAAKAGEKLVCEVSGLRVLGSVGDSWLKGYLEIRESSGKLVAASEGTSDDYYRWDPLILFTPEKDGEYTATFRDLNWRGDVRSVYRLSLGAVPHATGIFPLGGQRGTSVLITATGANLSAPQMIALPLDAPETQQLAFGAALNARPFQASSWPEVLAKDGCDSLASAQSVPWPCVVNGKFRAGKTDFFTFKIEQKLYAPLEVFSRRLGTPADPELALYDAKGTLLHADDDGRGQDGWIPQVLEPGQYTVAVRDLHGRGGDAFSYRLHLTPAVLTLAATVTPDTSALARGKSLPLSLKITRDHWDDDVTVTLAPTPGLSADTLTIPKGKTEGTLTLKVTADAPLGPVRLSVIATAKPNNTSLRTVARGQETYNIQGTAFPRDTLGPVLLLTEK